MSFPFTADDVIAAYKRHPKVKASHSWLTRTIDKGNAYSCCPAGIMALDKDHNRLVLSDRHPIESCKMILGLNMDQITGIAIGFDEPHHSKAILENPTKYQSRDYVDALRVGVECRKRLSEEGMLQ